MQLSPSTLALLTAAAAVAPSGLMARVLLGAKLDRYDTAEATSKEVKLDLVYLAPALEVPFPPLRVDLRITSSGPTSLHLVSITDADPLLVLQLQSSEEFLRSEVGFTPGDPVPVIMKPIDALIRLSKRLVASPVFMRRLTSLRPIASQRGLPIQVLTEQLTGVSNTYSFALHLDVERGCICPVCETLRYDTLGNFEIHVIFFGAGAHCILKCKVPSETPPLEQPLPHGFLEGEAPLCFSS